MTTGTVERDGEDIYWELVTDGDDDRRPVVVLSHGAGGNHAVWYQQIPDLGRRYRLVLWDSRGFGNSTNRNDAPGAEAAAGDLAAVLDRLEVERAHLVGQSMGGWHISAFAMANPERVRSLTYADTVGGLWTEELRTAFSEVSRQIGREAPGPTSLAVHRALWSGTAERDPAQAYLYQALGSFHSPPMDKLGATLNWEIAHDEIAALGVPVLFVAGTHDQLFPAPLLAASCARIPGARYAEIPASGHSPYFEQPQAWNDAVGLFLDSI